MTYIYIISFSCKWIVGLWIVLLASLMFKPAEQIKHKLENKCLSIQFIFVGMFVKFTDIQWLCLCFRLSPLNSLNNSIYNFYTVKCLFQLKWSFAQKCLFNVFKWRQFSNDHHLMTLLFNPWIWTSDNYSEWICMSSEITALIVF